MNARSIWAHEGARLTGQITLLLVMVTGVQRLLWEQAHPRTESAISAWNRAWEALVLNQPDAALRQLTTTQQNPVLFNDTQMQGLEGQNRGCVAINVSSRLALMAEKAAAEGNRAEAERLLTALRQFRDQALQTPQPNEMARRGVQVLQARVKRTEERVAQLLQTQRADAGQPASARWGKMLPPPVSPTATF